MQQQATGNSRSRSRSRQQLDRVVVAAEAHLIVPQLLLQVSIGVHAAARTFKPAKRTQAQQALKPHLRLLLLPDTRSKYKLRIVFGAEGSLADCDARARRWVEGGGCCLGLVACFHGTLGAGGGQDFRREGWLRERERVEVGRMGRGGLGNEGEVL